MLFPTRALSKKYLMRKFFLFSLACIIYVVSSAQNICGFEKIHNHNMRNNPAYAEKMSAFEARLKVLRDINLRSSECIPCKCDTLKVPDTIPVVVHIVHTGDTIGSIYNPSDQQIFDAVKYLNDVYSGTFSGVQGVGDMKVRFVLAKRDPFCNPTNGIVRVNGSVVNGYVSAGVNVNSGQPGVAEESIKNLSRWDSKKYYNIWVVNRIDGADGTSGGFVGGYAYFPAIDSVLDGTVLLATQMKRSNKTLPHELGHALFLYHPFHPTESSCPPSDPAQGDRCADTDPITASQSARSGENPCNGLNYSINTERNFMAYTQIFTLFTPNQKSRACNALYQFRAGLTQSEGRIPTSQQPACAAKVNFQTSLTSVRETTNQSNGCLGYRDYTIPVNLSNLLQNETLVEVLPDGGTALNGVDYQIFTQGNLVTPGNVLKFPQGSLNSQSLVLRVFDDADLENEEEISLKLNSLSNDLSVGEAAPKIIIKLTDNDLPPVFPNASNLFFSVGQSNITLVSQTSPLPFAGAVDKNRLQVLYLASELRTAGLKPGVIEGLSINVSTKRSSRPYDNFRVALGHTTLSALGSQFVSNSTLSTVYSGSYTTQKGDNFIIFSTPFTWDGTSNIIVQICYDNQGFSSLNDYVLGQSRSSTATFSLTAAGIGSAEACTLTPSYNATSRPFIVFLRKNPGNPVANSIVSSESYLGPNADVYFYDTTGLILARIRNLSSFDYGCTKLEVDRIGSAAQDFWYTEPNKRLTQKTFKVTPTNVNPGGNYEISLYYTGTEKTGFEQTTGINWSSVSMVKSDGPISAISPSNQQFASVTVNNNVSIGTFGTDYLVTSTFTNGFSGFAVGSPSGTTSVTDLQSLQGVSVYPNPVNKLVNIRFNKTQRNVSLRIMSADGRVWYQDQINGSVQNHTLRLDKLIKGLYLLEINSEEGRRTIPLIKQ
jgi:hypothetical protein